ncbi:MAG: hypothetical protein OEY59_10370 [Deltaproteobacteria bacterium]|nr:hypothetical protein [Deltaproteobacteria bacterium]
MRKNKIKIIKVWVFGSIISIIVTCFIASFFLNTVPEYQYDDELGFYSSPADFIINFRKEGWASTHFGRYSIAGIENINEINEPKVAIWGDSHVEAFQVDDQYKSHQVLTRIQSNQCSPFVGVGIGQSGWSIADYYFRIQDYERVSDFSYHFIVLNDFDDTYPNNENFKKNPHFKFTDKGQNKKPLVEIRHWINQFKLNALWAILKNTVTNPLTKKTRTLRFRPGPIDKKQSDDQLKTSNQEESWSFVFEKLKSITKKPIVFVYAPSVPTIYHNKINQGNDNSFELSRFKAFSKKYGFDVLDLTEDWNGFYNTTHQFPRGFINSVPSKGHWNEEGHYLVAKKIGDYLDKHKTCL